MYNPACCVLALLYGCIHRSVEKFCRDTDRAARAPHAVHPAAPGIGSSRGTLYHKPFKRSIPIMDLFEDIETLNSLWYLVQQKYMSQKEAAGAGRAGRRSNTGDLCAPHHIQPTAAATNEGAGRTCWRPSSPR